MDSVSPPQKTRSKVRSELSAILNRQLNRLGYALIRMDGFRNPTFTEYLGARYAYEDVTVTDMFAPWAIDEDFLSVWTRIDGHTLVDVYRCFELYDLVRQVSDIPGDIVEIGVWRGGTGAALASAATRWKPDAHVWLCDTYSGVVKAGPRDETYKGGEHADTSEQIVAQLLLDLDLRNASVVRGVFPEETAHVLGDRPVALCHIDVDVYQSAADIIEWLLPRTRSGSVAVFDDYGFSTCKGITRLVEELRADGNWRCIYNLNKHAILIRK